MAVVLMLRYVCFDEDDCSYEFWHCNASDLHACECGPQLSSSDLGEQQQPPLPMVPSVRPGRVLSATPSRPRHLQIRLITHYRLGRSARPRPDLSIEFISSIS
ncbi:hypothetical protein E2C01_005199 [Portunus trituberculatus]|uniref:Uncharacterized protein n=1 Tax=Portunus trituberculatus TaxID=210409 RepID=A0A5B7CSP7_PORTR|nr:hypothetical protein [Portunus trituberculatus]